MTIEQNKAIVRRFFEAFRANDQDTLKEVTASDLLLHSPGAPGPENREAMLQGIHAFSEAFSDRESTLHEMIAEGNLVSVRTSMKAVHTGEYFGQPATGRQIVIHAFTFERIKDGKIVERWFNYDRLDLMQQLGLVPPP